MPQFISIYLFFIQTFVNITYWKWSLNQWLLNAVYKTQFFLYIIGQNLIHTTHRWSVSVFFLFYWFSFDFATYLDVTLSIFLLKKCCSPEKTSVILDPYNLLSPASPWWPLWSGSTVFFLLQRILIEWLKCLMNILLDFSAQYLSVVCWFI